MYLQASLPSYGAFLLWALPSFAQFADTELGSPLDARGLVKRIITAQKGVILPIAGQGCDGPVKCVEGFCCAAGQSCLATGCAPEGSVGCSTGWCMEGWGCCGPNNCYDKAAGGQCCPGSGGIHGVWCPAGMQCISLPFNDYRCCTDKSCTIYLDGTTTLTSPSTPTPTPTAPPPPPPPPPAVTTCNPSGAQPTFQLQQTKSTDAQNGTFVGLSGSGNTTEVVFGLQATAGTNFTFNSACNLIDLDGDIANIHGPLGSTFSPLFFDKAATISAQGDIESVCDVTSGQLTCKANGKTQWMACGSPKTLSIGSQLGDGCVSIALTPQFT